MTTGLIRSILLFYFEMFLIVFSMVLILAGTALFFYSVAYVSCTHISAIEPWQIIGTPILIVAMIILGFHLTDRNWGLL